MKYPCRRYIKLIGVRHVQALLLFWGNLLCFSMRSMMSVAMVALTDAKSSNPDFPEFDWDTKIQSYIQSAVLWGCAVSHGPMGFLVSSPGAHRYLLCSVFGGCILIALTPLLAVNFGWIAVLCNLLAVGLGQGSTSSCIAVLITKWSPICERSQFASFVMNSSQIATMMTTVIAGVLAASRFGWPSIFYMYGVVGTTWSILFYYFGADSPATHSKITIEERKMIESSNREAGESENKQNMEFPWKAILTSVPVWTLIFTTTCQVWSFYMLMIELPMYMKAVLGFDIRQSGFIAALPYLTNWLLTLPLGWISDFAIRKGVRKAVVRKSINTIGMWGPALALLTLCTLKTNDRTTLVVILVFAVTLNAGVVPAQNLNELDLTPNFSAQLTGINLSLAKIVGSLAPVACGYMVTDQKNVNQWYNFFWISTALYFVGHLAFMFFGEVDVQPWNEPTAVKSSCKDKNRHRELTQSKEIGTKDSSSKYI